MAIFDAFMFFNELDLLEIRLNELSDVVDRFIVCEAPVTFQGRPKPLWFGANKDQERFKPFLDRITHLVVEDMPGGRGKLDSFNRAHHQRRAMRRAVPRLGRTDALIVSDVDEIPAASAVKRWGRTDGTLALSQVLSYYWVNCVSRSPWTAPKIICKKDYEEVEDLHWLRKIQRPSIKRGGWHFSFVGGIEAVRLKLRSFAAYKKGKRPLRHSDETLLSLMRAGRDLFGRKGYRYHFVPFDERFPAFLRENAERFSHLIYDERRENDG